MIINKIKIYFIYIGNNIILESIKDFFNKNFLLNNKPPNY